MIAMKTRETVNLLGLDLLLYSVEFGERVQRLGKMVSPLKLAGRLLDGIRVGQIPSAGLVATAGTILRKSLHLGILTSYLLQDN